MSISIIKPLLTAQLSTTMKRAFLLCMATGRGTVVPNCSLHLHCERVMAGECWVKADGHAYDPVLKRLFKNGVLVFQEDGEEHGAEGGVDMEGSAHREGEHEACDAVTYGDWIWDGADERL